MQGLQRQNKMARLVPLYLGEIFPHCPLYLVLRCSSLWERPGFRAGHSPPLSFYSLQVGCPGLGRRPWLKISSPRSMAESGCEKMDLILEGKREGSVEGRWP